MTNNCNGTNLALLVLRVYAGTAFLFHGWPKIQNPTGWMGPDAPMPALLLALAAISEFGGGLAWVLGLLTRPAAAGIFCTMSVAVWTHMSKGDPFVGRGGSWELAGVYWTIALTLLLVGPGVWSLDSLIFKKKQK